MNYVLDDPGDPNQISDESHMKNVGLFADAIMGLIATRRQEGHTASMELTAVDIFDHMVSRAKKYPTVFEAIVDIPLAGKLYLLHKAEADADSDACLAAMRMLMSDFCSSNATSYAMLDSEFFVFWFCASHAERMLFMRELFFRQTRGGSNIFPDRWVEHNVRYTRQYTGKKAVGAYHAMKVKEVVTLPNQRVAAKAEYRQKVPDTEKGRKELQLDKTSQEAYLYSRDLNLFGPGPPRHAPSKPWKKRKSEDRANWPEASEDISELKDPTGKHLINPEILIHASTGDERAKIYFDTYCKHGDRSRQSRNEKGASLEKVEADGRKVVTAAHEQLQRWVSLDEEFMNKRFLVTANELKAELKRLNETLSQGDQVEAERNEKGNTTKKSLVKAVIAARRKLINIDSEWAANELNRRREASTPAQCEGDNYEARRDKELGLPLYTFEGTEARNLYRQRKHTIPAIHASGAASNEETLAQPQSPGSIASPAAEPSLTQDSARTAFSSPSSAGYGVSRLYQSLRDL